MKKRERKYAAAAIVTIRDADKMTPSGRRAIAKWLKNHAEWLLKHGKEYNRTFTGRYLYPC